MSYRRNSEEAREQAQVNADWSGDAWGYFADTTGNWRCESWSSCSTVPGATRVNPEPPSTCTMCGEQCEVVGVAWCKKCEDVIRKSRVVYGKGGGE